MSEGENIPERTDSVPVLRETRVPVNSSILGSTSFSSTFYRVGTASDKMRRECVPGKEVVIMHNAAEGEGHARSRVEVLEVKEEDGEFLARMKFVARALKE